MLKHRMHSDYFFLSLLIRCVLTRTVIHLYRSEGETDAIRETNLMRAICLNPFTHFSSIKTSFTLKLHLHACFCAKVKT